MRQDFVNADVLHMAESLAAQAESIQDSDDNAGARRAHLHRVVGHLHLAYAELAELMSLPSPKQR